MKAGVIEKLGVVSVQEVPEPELLSESMLIRVEACAICGSDIRIFRKGDPRATFPRIVGHEIAGVVEKVGNKVKKFNIGDRVAVAPGHGCGKCKYCLNGMGNVCINPRPSVGYASSGGFAQYLVPPVNVVENGFVNIIPPNVSFEEASMAELLACCINGQERAEVSQGDTVVIIGAGPAGCMHVGLAKARGAMKVILVERLMPRLLLAKEKFKPDVIISGEDKEVIRRVKEETGGLGADVIIVAAPSPQAQEAALSMIAPRGRVIFFGGLPKDNKMITIDANIIHYTECSITGASSSLGRQNREALDLISQGLVNAKEYITRRFTLDQIVMAFDAVENKEAIKVVIFPWA
jgi:L-iditol 2-dehydrogenase